MQVRGDGGRREGRILGGVFRPRFSGRIWRFLRAKLGVVLVGSIARFSDDSDDSDDGIARICYDETIPAGGPARIPYFEGLTHWTASYFSDHWGGVRAGCDSSETAHSSDSEDYGMPRPARPRGSRAARRRRVAIRTLQEMLRALRALRGFREVLRAFRALRAAGPHPSAG